MEQTGKKEIYLTWKLENLTTFNQNCCPATVETGQKIEKYVQNCFSGTFCYYKLHHHCLIYSSNKRIHYNSMKFAQSRSKS